MKQSEDHRKLKKNLRDSLSRLIKANQNLLVHTAQLVNKAYNYPVLQKLLELQFYVLYVDNEIRYLSLIMMRSSESHVYLDKYMALLMFETLETLPKMYGEVVRSVNELERENKIALFDSERLKQAYTTYRRNIAPFKSNDVLMNFIRLARNSIAAHHLHKEGGIQPLVTWYLHKNSEIPNDLGGNELTAYASRLGEMLFKLGRDIEKSFKFN